MILNKKAIKTNIALRESIKTLLFLMHAVLLALGPPYHSLILLREKSLILMV